LESAWLEYYLTSPLWRFALSPGACGEDAYAGVLMPSVDRVGRYFPLTIVVPLGREHSLLELTTADWFERAEETALAGLDEHLAPEDFVERVRTLGLPYISKSPLTAWLTEDTADPAWHCALGDLAKLNEVGNELADQLLRWRFPQYTLWWSHGSERIAACLLICQGLPPTQGFAALLAGEWERWGWSERPLASQSLIL
jgi:type VI secretion system protein ImpM